MMERILVALFGAFYFFLGAAFFAVPIGMLFGVPFQVSLTGSALVAVLVFFSGLNQK
jgi:hypothetical protein